MVQDIRTEKVFEELAMTGAQSESALWSILGFYFSIIFGLLAVLILLKTVKLGSLLDFSSKDCLTEATESHEEGKRKSLENVTAAIFCKNFSCHVHLPLNPCHFFHILENLISFS